MRQFSWYTLAATGALLLPGSAFAEGEGDAFERLDANKDGQLAAEEAGDRRRIFERLLKAGDKNKDGKLSKEEFIVASKEAPREEEPRREEPRRPEGERPNPERVAEYFDKMDTDKDGKLTEKDLPEGRREGFGRMLERFDKNGDKSISKEEFIKGAAEGDRRPDAPPAGDRRPNPERIAEEFNRLDKNKDGKIVADEAPEGARDRFEQMLARFDKDGDKAISKEEFVKGITAGEGRAEGGGPGEIFTRLDANKDGKLSDDEIPADKREQFQKAIAKLDKKPEGGITREQFIRIVTLMQGGERKPEGRPEPRPEGRPEGRPEAGGLLGLLDVDHDGKLSASEIADAPKHLAELDKNKDGNVTQDELRTLFGRPLLRPDAPREGVRRPEGDRPREGERKPEGDRPREERKVEGDRPREGEKKPEGDRPRDGEKKPDAERKTTGDRKE